MAKFKMLVYGIGAEYNRISTVLYNMGEQLEIIGFITTDKQPISIFEGKRLFCIGEIKSVEYDYIIVAIAGWKEIVKILDDNGVSREKILFSRIFDMPRFDLIKYLEISKKDPQYYRILVWLVSYITCLDGNFYHQQ